MSSQSPLTGLLLPKLLLSIRLHQIGEEQVLPGVPSLPTSVGSATQDSEIVQRLARVTGSASTPSGAVLSNRNMMGAI